MLKNFGKFFVIFLIIFAWIFSGWPRIWEKPPIPPKIQEAQAAIAIRAVGAYISGTANITPVIPATAAAGDMMLLIYGTKPYSDVPSYPAGWVEIGSATDGTVAAGTDLGSMRTSIAWKQHSGTETNPLVTNTTNNVSSAVIIVFQKDAGQNWVTPVGAGGGDATAGTNFSVTASSDVGHTTGDMVVGYAAIRSDAGGTSAWSITITGCTMGTFTGTNYITTSGGDMAMGGGYVPVNSGTSSAAPVFVATLAAAHTGSAFMVRLRQVAPSAALTGTVTAAITEADIVAGGKTIILTLTNDTWVAAGATFDAQRQNIINGLDSAQAEATGWDAVVKATQGVSGVVRTSDTVVTITLNAFASYNITATETITATIPATALVGGNAIVATPTFTISAAAASVTCTTPLTQTTFALLTNTYVATSTPDATTTVNCSACTNGFTIQVSDKGNGPNNPGLWNSSDSVLIGSADAELSAGIGGYGIQATTTTGNGININPKFLWATSTNIVGGLTASSTWVTLASSTGAVTNQIITVSHKAAVSVTTKPGSYSDTIYYQCFVNE